MLTFLLTAAFVILFVIPFVFGIFVLILTNKIIRKWSAVIIIFYVLWEYIRPYTMDRLYSYDSDYYEFI